MLSRGPCPHAEAPSTRVPSSRASLRVCGGAGLLPPDPRAADGCAPASSGLQSGFPLPSVLCSLTGTSPQVCPASPQLSVVVALPVLLLPRQSLRRSLRAWETWTHLLSLPRGAGGRPSFPGTVPGSVHHWSKTDPRSHPRPLLPHLGGRRVQSAPPTPWPVAAGPSPRSCCGRPRRQSVT